MTEQEKRCAWCVNYRYIWAITYSRQGETGRDGPKPFCALGHDLIPCDSYEREVGADDDKGEPC